MMKKNSALIETKGIYQIGSEITEEGKKEKEQQPMKRKMITQNCHLRKTDSLYLLQLEEDTSQIHVFVIPKKKVEPQQVDLTFSTGMGFYHSASSFYVGGGTVNWSQYSPTLISPKGEYTELRKMPTPKMNFPMALWKEGSTLFTLGGWNGSRLK